MCPARRLGDPPRPNPRAPWRPDRALLLAGPRRPLHSALAFDEVAYRPRARRCGFDPHRRRTLRKPALLLTCARTEAIRCLGMARGHERRTARAPLEEVKTM